MDLFTGNNFTVVRQLADHTDASTYYVQAVIRNAYTDAIITTLNLDFKSNQRFTKAWKVPQDPSGEGFYVSIVSSVYTDSGYATKSDNYGDEEQSYLVVDNPNALGARGSGGMSANTPGNGGGLIGRDVRDIISEELKKILPELKPEKPKEVTVEKPTDYSTHFEQLLRAIEANKPEKPEKVDLDPVFTAISEVKKAIDDKKIPELDIEPIMHALSMMHEGSEITADELKSILGPMQKALAGQLLKEFEEVVKQIQFVTTFVNHARLEGGNVVKVPDVVVSPKPPKHDISKLST